MKEPEETSGNKRGIAKEEARMEKVWGKVKESLYQEGLDKLDETAKSLVTLSSALITIGFSVTAAMVNAKILQVSHVSLWFSFSGFFCFMLSTISCVLIIFRRPFRIGQLALPLDISSAWENSRSTKYWFMKWAYAFFFVGTVLEIVAIASLIV
jgi:hypothetical protein